MDMDNRMGTDRGEEVGGEQGRGEQRGEIGTSVIITKTYFCTELVL